MIIGTEPRPTLLRKGQCQPKAGPNIVPHLLDEFGLIIVVEKQKVNVE